MYIELTVPGVHIVRTTPHCYIIKEQCYKVELCMTVVKLIFREKIIVIAWLEKDSVKIILNDFISGDLVFQPRLVMTFQAPCPCTKICKIFWILLSLAYEESGAEFKYLPKVTACKCWSWNLSLDSPALKNFHAFIPCIMLLFKRKTFIQTSCNRNYFCLFVL